MILLHTPDGTEEAPALLHEAAEAGLPAAHYMLGVIAAVAPDDNGPAAAAAHFRTVAELGHGAAQFRYGLALLNGHGVRRDELAGETWLRRAALGGQAVAAALVGDLYARQSPLPPNYCEAGT